jgi:hypothetical protein
LVTTDTLPDWPPPAGHPIGEERARAYIDWIRDHVRPLVNEARQMIADRYPDISARTSAVTVEQLATWSVPPDMPRLNIGVVWCEPVSGALAMVNIDILQDGRLEARPGLRMRE